MASQQRSRLAEMLNGPAPQSSSPPASASPPPSGGTGSIKYTESALNQFAGTSDARATSFRQLHTRAGQIQVDGNAFGYMFGRLVYSAYEQHVQAISDGLTSAADSMTEIADSIRETAQTIQEVESETSQAASRAVGSGN